MKKIIFILLAAVLCLSLLAVAETEAAKEQGVYVLMNIPYDKFYASEVSVTEGLDTVSSATLNKPRTGGLAGGSYHVDPAGSDISGVIFPVYVEDANILSTLGGIEITDESSVEITVTNRGKETTTVYEGKDALFEAPSYSWYALDGVPALYKTLDAAALSFSAIEAEAQSVEGQASFVYDRHADMTLSVEGISEVLNGANVSAVILTADDGTSVGLRHIANLWRGSQIGFAYDSAIYKALKGKRISEIKYITLDVVYAMQVDIAVSDDALLPRLTGTYIELFPEFAKEEYKDYWMECIKAYEQDDAAAEAYYTALTQSYMGTLKGQAAIDAFGGDPESMVFDCFFENGISRLVISGDVIKGYDAQGNELFDHAYAFEGEVPVSFFGMDMGIALRVYKTADEDAGAYRYFAFTDDTLAETFHIEFRYGESMEALGDYSDGEYAYWLAAGINEGYRENQIKSCIKLFVDENVGGEEE